MSPRVAKYAQESPLRAAYVHKTRKVRAWRSLYEQSGPGREKRLAMGTFSAARSEAYTFHSAKKRGCCNSCAIAMHVVNQRGTHSLLPIAERSSSGRRMRFDGNGKEFCRLKIAERSQGSGRLTQIETLPYA